VSLVAGYLISEWLAAAIHHRLPSGWQAAGLAAWLLTLLAVSEVVRNRRAYLRAARQQEVDAERSRAEAARRQASEQRLGIARDLHDVLAHSISLINVQAGVALELIDQQPEQARSALAAIKQTSKQALVEVQSVLADLRSPEERAPRTPTPTVADLSDLIESAQAAGLRLSTVTSGDPVALSSTVALAGYRIVQEALTNVARHAGQVATKITLCYTADSLSIEVTNEAGRRTSQDGTGLGIRGMRDRVTSLGGTLHTGPTVRGGFTIHAVLPATAEQA
jgi:signal transduction histidine kinase